MVIWSCSTESADYSLKKRRISQEVPVQGQLEQALRLLDVTA